MRQVCRRFEKVFFLKFAVDMVILHNPFQDLDSSACMPMAGLSWDLGRVDMQTVPAPLLPPASLATTSMILCPGTPAATTPAIWHLAANITKNDLLTRVKVTCRHAQEMETVTLISLPSTAFHTHSMESVSTG